MVTIQQDKGVQSSKATSSDSSSMPVRHLHGGHISHLTASEYSPEKLVGDLWSEFQSARIAAGGAHILGHGAVTQPTIGGSEIAQVVRRNVATVVVNPRQGIVIADNWNAIQPHWGGSVATLGHYRFTTLLTVLRRHRKATVAERIERYLDLRDREPDRPPIVIGSLRSLVKLFIEVPDLLPPIVGSDPRGCMEIEWHLRDNGDPDSVWGRGNGVVSLKFLESGDIQFVALSGPFRRGQERLKLNGTASRNEIMADLHEFAQMVTTS